VPFVGGSDILPSDATYIEQHTRTMKNTVTVKLTINPLFKTNMIIEKPNNVTAINRIKSID
jgi:hypothetical protein